MRRLTAFLLSVFFITGLLVTPSIAKGPSKQAGDSNIGHLYLYEKAPLSDDRAEPWEVVEGGMWGKMKYNLSGPTFDFVFNGHGLPVLQEYTLIYYPDPWPGAGLICLGSGLTSDVVICGLDAIDCMPDDGGNIHIAESVETGGDLPIDADANSLEGDAEGDSGAKIFLVPSGDVDCENQIMIGWTGDDANLYEDVLITFKYTADE